MQTRPFRELYSFFTSWDAGKVAQKIERLNSVLKKKSNSLDGQLSVIAQVRGCRGGGEINSLEKKDHEGIQLKKIFDFCCCIFWDSSLFFTLDRLAQGQIFAQILFRLGLYIILRAGPNRLVRRIIMQSRRYPCKCEGSTYHATCRVCLRSTLNDVLSQGWEA
jgi:hypothetical protein